MRLLTAGSLVRVQQGEPRVEKTRVCSLSSFFVLFEKFIFPFQLYPPRLTKQSARSMVWVSQNGFSVFYRIDGRQKMMKNFSVLCPKQPFFLYATSHYCKHIVGNREISHFYAFVADDMDVCAMGIPDGCVDILYRCNPEHPEILLSGTGFSPRPLRLLKGESYFGIRFSPGYLPKFRSISFAETVSRDLLFEELENEQDMHAHIVYARSFEERIRAFLSWYNHKFGIEEPVDRMDLKQYVRMEIIKHHGTKRIQQIAEETGYSDRYIARVFKENYGMNPKQFSEIIQFQNLLQSLQECQEKTINFMSVAVEYAYYDESHMLKFFHRYLQETPKEYYRYIQSDLYHQKLDIL